MRKWHLLIFGGFLILILAFLAGGLRGTEFHGGRPLPSSGSAPEGPSFLGSPASGEWIVDLFRLTIFLGLVLAAITLIFSRNFRKHVVYLLVTLAAFLFLWYSLSRLPMSSQPPAPQETRSEAGELGEGKTEERPVCAPSWAIYLAPLGISVGLAVWLGPRLASALERKRTKKAIQGVAQQAVCELKQGAPVADVVLRAWLRMVEILCARFGTRDQPQLTPREFAENMARLGFKHEAVEILTKLFEEVRYGHKESEPRREQAIAALAALERALA